MAGFIIGTIKKYNTVLGYRVFSLLAGGDVTSVRDISVSDLEVLLSSRDNASLVNACLNSQGKVEFTQGAMSAYPVLDSNNVIQTNVGLTILYAVVNDADEVIGYGVVDTYGVVVNISKSKLIALSAKYKCTNWEIYTTKSGEREIRAKSGTFYRVKKQQVKVVSPENKKRIKIQGVASVSYENADGTKDKEDSISEDDLMKINKEIKQSIGAELSLANTKKDKHVSSELISLSSDFILPCLKVYDIKDCVESDSNKDVQIKLANIKANLGIISPYYSLMYDAIQKAPCTAIPTMAVTEDKLMYNPKYLLSLSIADASFIVIHEMLHIAMQHSLRHGTRHNAYWNIACDLYINATICKDFGCSYGGDVIRVEHKSDFDGKLYIGVISAPPSSLYIESIGETLDFKSDTAESIYNRIMEENQQGSQGQGSQGQGNQGQGNQGQGNQGQGSQGQGNQGQGNQGQGSQGQGGQGQGNQGQGSQGQGNQGQGNQGTQEQSSSDVSESNAGTDVSNEQIKSMLESDSKDTDNSEYNEASKSVDISYKGKRLKGDISLDITSNRSTVDKDSKKESLNETKTALKRIKVKKDYVESKTGKECTVSRMGEMVERTIDFALTASYNWEQLVRQLVSADHKQTYTLSSPNTRYGNMGMTLATRQKIGKKEKIKNLKICVDVSGSITETELHEIFSKIAQILQKCEVTAELIYWDTSVTNVGEFETVKEMIKIKPYGFGGTDVTCVFDYLMGITKFEGIKESTPVKDMAGVLVFTDGCFGSNYEKYEKYFGRRTYWILPDKAPIFKPLFGKVILARL